jgi:hypothetical protein
MLEFTIIFLAATQATALLGLLVFFYLREKNQTDYISSIQTIITEVPTHMQQFYMQLQNDKEFSTQKTIKELTQSHLKHIQALEKLAMPAKIDEAGIQRILDLNPQSAPEPNDIEKEEDLGIELTEENFANVPINSDTKVLFDGDPKLTALFDEENSQPIDEATD